MPFMRKTLNKVGTEGTYLKIIKVIYDKPTAQNTLKAFLLKSRIRQGCPLLLLLFKRVLGVLFTAIRPEKEMNPNWKGRGKMVTLCRGHDTVYIEPDSLNTKTIRANKRSQQSNRMQDE